MLVTDFARSADLCSCAAVVVPQIRRENLRFMQIFAAFAIVEPTYIAYKLCELAA